MTTGSLLWKIDYVQGEIRGAESRASLLGDSSLWKQLRCLLLLLGYLLCVMYAELQALSSSETAIAGKGLRDVLPGLKEGINRNGIVAVSQN